MNQQLPGICAKTLYVAVLQWAFSAPALAQAQFQDDTFYVTAQGGGIYTVTGTTFNGKLISTVGSKGDRCRHRLCNRRAAAPLDGAAHDAGTRAAGRTHPHHPDFGRILPARIAPAPIARWALWRAPLSRDGGITERFINQDGSDMCG